MTGQDDTRLQRYVALVLACNRVMNVTGARDEGAIWEHIDDSLTLVPYVRDPHVDVGSGGGFPGIPLAIVCGVRVTLLESIAKKARFLEEVAAALALPVTVVCARAEEAGRDPAYRERFASATARAVSAGPTVLELTIPLLTVGGVVLLQRGKMSEWERSALHDAALVLGAEIGEETMLAGSDEKRIIPAWKRSVTSMRFPRRNGAAMKRPLCVDGTV